MTRLEHLTIHREYFVLVTMNFKAAFGEVDERTHPLVFARAARLFNCNGRLPTATALVNVCT